MRRLLPLLSPGAIGEEVATVSSGLFPVLSGMSPDKRLHCRYNDREQSGISVAKQSDCSLGDLIRP